VEAAVLVEGQLRLARAGQQVVERPAGVPFPPGALGLALQPGGVPEQLAQAHPTQRRAGQVHVQPVIEVEPALVAQPEYHRRGQALGDRPEPELQVAMGYRHLAGPADMGERPLPDHGCHQRRRPAVGLGAGDEFVQLAGGIGAQEHGSA
jgi:hypothetical protein